MHRGCPPPAVVSFAVSRFMPWKGSETKALSQQIPLGQADSVEKKECFSEWSTVSAQGWHVGQEQVNAGEYHGFSSSIQHKPRDVGHSFIFIFETVMNSGRHCPGTSHKKSGTPCTAVQTVHCVIPEKTK